MDLPQATALQQASGYSAWENSCNSSEDTATLRLPGALRPVHSRSLHHHTSRPVQFPLRRFVITHAWPVACVLGSM